MAKNTHEVKSIAHRDIVQMLLKIQIAYERAIEPGFWGLSLISLTKDEEPI